MIGRCVLLLTALVGTVVAGTAVAGAAAPRTWAVESTPAPSGPNGDPARVSCPDETMCMAVGTSVNRIGRQVAYARVWDGAAWHDTTTHTPSAAYAAALEAVSCASPTSCVAVGEYSTMTGTVRNRTLTEVWDGTVWRYVPSPSRSVAEPDGFAELTGVSCWAAGGCLAVGTHTPTSTTSTSTLVERWNGSVWTVVPSSDIAGAQYMFLNAISCASETACLAVGSSWATISSGPAAYTEAWDGQHWHTTRTQRSPRWDRSTLEAVSCVEYDECYAVGSYGDGAGQHTLVEQWDSVVWNHVPSPDNTAARYNDLTGVSCVPNGCVAVGSAGGIGAGYGHSASLAEVYDGVSWQVVDSPRAGLTDVSCPLADDCLAVGDRTTNLGAPSATAATWDGSSWNARSGPSATGGVTTTVSDLACSAATCALVGSTVDATNHQVTFAEVRSVGRWRITSTPLPAERASDLAAVSCPTANTCIAVGKAADGAASRSLADVWDGTSWTSTPVVNAPGRDQLTDISCTSADACMAVGSATTSHDEHTIAERWDGSTWTLAPVPDVASAIDTYLTSVSCAAADDCVAVGDVVAVSGDPAGLVTEPAGAHWDGTAWTVSTESSQGQLSSVSCTSSTFCLAIGDRDPQTDAIAETWNGSTWTHVAVPSPAAGPTLLRDVSCTSPRSCLAVGAKLRTATWNGHTWTLGQVADPGPRSTPLLDAVTCSSTGRCRVAGNRTSVLPFVEVSPNPS